MRFPTMWYVRPAKALISLRVCLSLEYSMGVKLLTELHLEFLSLKGGCTGSSESTLVKMSYCWKSHVTAQINLSRPVAVVTVCSKAAILLSAFLYLYVYLRLSVFCFCVLTSAESMAKVL